MDSYVTRMMLRATVSVRSRMPLRTAEDKALHVNTPLCCAQAEGIVENRRGQRCKSSDAEQGLALPHAAVLTAHETRPTGTHVRHVIKLPRDKNFTFVRCSLCGCSCRCEVVVAGERTGQLRQGLFLLHCDTLHILKPSGHYMYGQFNTQQFYVLPTQLYLCVLCGSQNKQPLFPYTALTDWFS